MTAKKYFTDEERKTAKRAADAKYQAANPDKHRAKQARYQAKHPEKKRLHQAKRYGCPPDLTADWEHACLHGSCEICNRPAAENRHGRLSKDHSHTTPPTPRGCLCDQCNRGLGYFQDSPELLTKAIQYLSARDPRYAK